MISLLSNQQTLSSPARLLLTLAKIQLTDLQALGGGGAPDKERKGGSVIDRTLKKYAEAHDMLLAQVGMRIALPCFEQKGDMFEKCRGGGFKT